MLSTIKKTPLLQSEAVRQGMTYFIAALIFFALLITANRFFDGMEIRPHLYCFMAVVLIVGTVNWWILERPIYNNLPLWAKASMTLSANFLGGVFFMSFLTNSQVGLVLLPALLLFSLPWFFVAAYGALMTIPALQYHPIQVLNLRDIAGEINWAENEERGIIWEFEQLAEMETETPYGVRTHTPHNVMDMRLKELFKGLLSLHNHNISPGRPIHFKEQRIVRQIASETNVGGSAQSKVVEHVEVPLGWRFFHQKNYYLWQSWQPLDPEKTLCQNGVRFIPLSKEERAAITNLRKGLSPKFKTTKIFIERL